MRGAGRRARSRGRSSSLALPAAVRSVVESLDSRLLMADISGNYSFQPVRIGAGGFVTNVYISPQNANVRFARNDTGQAYRWDNSAGEWKPMFVYYQGGNGIQNSSATTSGPGQPQVVSVAVDPNNTSNVYMAAFVGRQSYGGTNLSTSNVNVYRSTDGGVTFNPANLSLATSGFNNDWRMIDARLAVDPSNSSVVYFGTYTGGLYKSTDGGATFSAVTSLSAGSTSPGIVAVKPVPGSGTVSVSGVNVTKNLYAVVGNGDVYYSTNGGQGWSNVSSGTGLAGKSYTATLDAASNLWVTQVSSKTIWKYNGSSWASYTPALNQNANGVAVDPNNTSRIFVSDISGVISRSTDGGNNWTNLGGTLFSNSLGWLPQTIGASPGSWRSNGGIYFDKNSQLYMAEGNEGILKYTPQNTDTNATWAIDSKGIENQVTHDVVLLPGSGDKAVLATEDTTGFVITNPDTFSAKQIPLQNQLISNGVSVAYAPNAPSYVAVGSADFNSTGSGQSYSGYSTDGGNTWQKFGSQAARAGSIAVSARGNWGNGSDHLVMLPANGEPPYYSKDGGNTWTKTGSFSTNSDGTISGLTSYFNFSLKQRQLKADPFVPDKYYLKFVSSSFYVSTDGGVTWQLQSNAGLPDATFHGQLVANRNVQNDLWFVSGWEGASSNGLWHSTDGGQTFQKSSAFDQAHAIDIGKGSGNSGDANYTVYVYGKLAGDNNWGIFRSTNGGSSWDRVSYNPNGEFDQVTSLGASYDTFGLVYVGTFGNSFSYGKQTGTTQPPPTSNLPSGWTGTDIGGSTPAGSSNFSNGTYTINGGGSDIWGTADQFQYAYQSVSGDQTITAQVTSQSNTDPWAKAGVMFRNSTGAGAAYVAVEVTPTNGVRLQVRNADGSSAFESASTGGGAGTYVRLVKSGNNFTAFTSSDGSNWTQFGTVQVTFSNSSYLAGLAVTSHNTGNLSTAAFNNVSITAPSTPLPSGWTNSDIGGSTPTGSSSFSNGTYTINGGGSDIWFNNDQFQYAYQSVSGDQTLTARVNSQTNTDPWAKAGIMFRNSTAAGAAYVAVELTPGNGIRLQVRNSDGANSIEPGYTSGSAGTYIRLVKSGNNFTAYTSSDGSNWTQFATAQVTFSNSTYLAGLAVSSHNTTSLSTATFTNVSISGAASGLPSGWTSGDINSPTIAGSTTYSSGTYTVKGSGADIWSPSDQFQYAYQTLSGDQTLTAQITSQTNTDSWAKAGVMLRADTSGSSAFAAVELTPGNGIRFQFRSTNGASDCADVRGPGGSAPVWVRIVKSGSTITAYSSTNGSNWTNIGSTSSVVLGSNYLAGLAVSSHNNASLSTVTFTNVSVSSGSATLSRLTSGTASASSNPVSTESPSNAFDGNNATKWLGNMTSSGAWLQFDLGSGNSAAVKSYSLTSASDDYGRDPTQWILQGSNDGSSWSNLDSQSAQSFSGRGVTKSYNISNTTNYRYYRLLIQANSGSTETNFGGTGLVQLAELSLLA